MAESIPVRCPSCLRDHEYASPVYPCACGAPLVPPLLSTAPPERIVRRTWAEDWVMVRCPGCGRQDHWPQPELGCPCGTLLRIPVRPAGSAVPGAGGDRAGVPAPPARPPAHIPLPRTAGTPRPAFRPVTIRTARDAVVAAELYLTWLGFREVGRHEVHRPEVRPEVRRDARLSTTVDLRGTGLIAQVDPSTRPITLRDVECLWLNGLSAPPPVSTVFFSLAGYADDARSRAEALGVPLFVLDLTGCPQPVNGPAAELVSTGA
ncbi:hypothetical protein ACWF94_13465 [Streptomyces sp. NPDC055078]